MLDENIHELEFQHFRSFVNTFLTGKGYAEQSDGELQSIIENSGLMYYDDENKTVGFKQQAFIEYLASIEIYDHKRQTHYNKLLSRFNDPSWQNAAIFFAGRSKDLPEMIEDLLREMPNNDINDWFFNTGGLGYIAQALYETDKQERMRLIRKALDNLVLCFYDIKELSKRNDTPFEDIPLPLIAIIMNYWFCENFKSVTLKETLISTYTELKAEYPNPSINDFDGDFKLFMVASALYTKYIGEQTYFDDLLDRPSFVKNPVLMVAGDSFLDTGDFNWKKATKEQRDKLDKAIKGHRDFLKHLLKEPAYRFNTDYKLLDE